MFWDENKGKKSKHIAWSAPLFLEVTQTDQIQPFPGTQSCCRPAKYIYAKSHPRQTVERWGGHPSFPNTGHKAPGSPLSLAK